MPTSEELKNFRIEADSVAGSTVRQRELGFSKEQLLREHNILKHTILKHLGFDLETATREYEDDLKIEKQRLSNEEFERFVADAKFKERYTAESERLVYKTIFAVSVDNETKQIPWDSKLTDPVTGEKTPTLWELFKEEYRALADPTAITSPQEFVEDISRRADRQIIDYQFNRFNFFTAKGDTYEANRWQHSEQRFYVAHFMIRSKCPSKL